MKHLVNSIDNAVSESLSGLCCAYPRLEYQEAYKVILAPDIANRGDKVSLICGGGSGHEPFSAGYVGEGMLTAAVAGSIFAAPPSTHISYAIERVSTHNKGGILMVIPNYTGDCLNFGIAIEKARQSGTRIAEIIVNEDCSIPKEEQGVAGKRGLTGMVVIIKIAGALAERGLPLQEVERIAHRALENMATYAVGLTACAIPGQGLMFEMPEDVIEAGMGLHGEAGKERIKLGTAEEVVSFMLKQVCASLSLTSGDSVAVIINNFGALSQLEQGIIVHEVVKQLKNMNIQPARVYCGLLVTSLNSAGVHITLLRLPDSHRDTFIGCLDDPTNAPAWPGCAYSVPLSRGETRLDKGAKRTVEKIGVEMDARGQELLRLCLERACVELIEKENDINGLDRGCGDGDCGTTLKRFAEGVKGNLSNFHLSHPSSVLSELANIAEERMGGTSGALYCLFFTTAAKELASVEEKKDWLVLWARVLRSGLDCLVKYGKAKPGDRTMIDSMDVACTTYEKLLAKPSNDLYERVAAAAWQGCEATRNMEPKAGRASYVKQAELLKEVDAGAFAAATWIDVIARTILNFKG